MILKQPASSQVSTSRLDSQHLCGLSATWQRCRYGATAFSLLVSLGLPLSGCDIGSNLWDLIHTEGDAQAQIFTKRQRVRTFVIVTESFSIETENDDDQTPTVTASDSVTEYTMQSNGTVRFDESNGDSNQLLDVESGDRIIERPGASGTGTLTVIDVAPGTS
jgi:hypothetical protein